MNAYVTPLSPLADAIAELISRADARLRAFLASEPVPTWTEYLADCHKK
ncbi:hypothetical protein [Aliiroseovarius sp.]|nr:hypothetical protein [Aliiroseovarius sp.]